MLRALARTCAELSANKAGKQQVKLLSFGRNGGSAQASHTKRELSRWGIEQHIVETAGRCTLDDYRQETATTRIDAYSEFHEAFATANFLAVVR